MDKKADWFSHSHPRGIHTPFQSRCGHLTRSTTIYACWIRLKDKMLRRSHGIESMQIYGTRECIDYCRYPPTFESANQIDRESVALVEFLQANARGSIMKFRTGSILDVLDPLCKSLSLFPQRMIFLKYRSPSYQIGAEQSWVRFGITKIKPAIGSSLERSIC